MSEKIKSFGQYELIKKIGKGGMAEIFLARETMQHGIVREVVIKKIHDHLSQNEEFITMFHDEARIAVRLTHPNVVQIYDVGNHDGSFYIAMEYIRGNDIRQIYNQAFKKKYKILLPYSIQMIIGACEALHYAHQMRDLDGKKLRLVHRDVSPQNIIIGYDGTVKVVDFGVAKASNQMYQTKVGVLKGKYSYMSPEQALGQAVDFRTDVFALGVILYELTCGKRLFKRESEVATLHAVIEAKFKLPSEIIPGYPNDLEKIIIQALQKEKEKRYTSALEMKEALENVLIKRKILMSMSHLSFFMHDLFDIRDETAQTTLKNLEIQGQAVLTTQIHELNEDAESASAEQVTGPTILAHSAEPTIETKVDQETITPQHSEEANTLILPKKKTSLFTSIWNRIHEAVSQIFAEK